MCASTRVPLLVMCLCDVSVLYVCVTCPCYVYSYVMCRVNDVCAVMNRDAIVQGHVLRIQMCIPNGDVFVLCVCVMFDVYIMCHW